MQRIWRFFLILRCGVICFFQYHYYIRCGALTYTSLLGCIPVFSVFVAALSKLPVVKSQLPQLQNFVLHTFLPVKGEKFIDYITTFSHQAQALPWSQFMFLIFVSIVLVFSVERTINSILGEQKAHAILQGFVRSWFAIILMILLMITSFILSSYILSIPVLVKFKVIAILHDYSSWWLPFLSSFLGFTIVYYIVPSRSPHMFHALLGGVIASALFEVMKLCFAWFIVQIPTYNAIYGTLAIIPIFMIWVYSFWCVFIYCALLVRELM